MPWHSRYTDAPWPSRTKTRRNEKIKRRRRSGVDFIYLCAFW